MILPNKKLLLGTFLLIASIGCSNEKENKKILEKNTTSTTEKIKLIDGLKPVLDSKIVYSINDKKYGIDSLPQIYSNTSGLQRKRFLDLYLKYKLTLDSLKLEQSLYKKKINAKLKLELDRIAYRGINQNILDKTVYSQKLTLEQIALEEVSKKEENLTQKMTQIYKTNQDKFKYPNTIELSFIVLKDKKKAEYIFSALNKTKITIQDFGKFAFKHSIDRVSRVNDGYAGYMTKETAGEETFNTIWNSPKLGLVNQILEKNKKFLLIYTHKKIKANIKNFDSVKEEIREKLLNNNRNKWIKEKYHNVIQKTKVKIYDSFENNQIF